MNNKITTLRQNKVVAAPAEELGEAFGQIRDIARSLPRAQAVGVLELVKHELIRDAQAQVDPTL